MVQVCGLFSVHFFRVSLNCVGFSAAFGCDGCDAFTTGVSLTWCLSSLVSGVPGCPTGKPSVQVCCQGTDNMLVAKRI